MTEPDDAALDLEFAWTTWADSCRDASPSMHECRRAYGHDGAHAAGFGSQRRRWDDVAA